MLIRGNLVFQTSAGHLFSLGFPRQAFFFSRFELFAALKDLSGQYPPDSRLDSSLVIEGRPVGMLYICAEGPKRVADSGNFIRIPGDWMERLAINHCGLL